MAFLDKISQVGQGTVQKAKDVSEVVKLNNEITDLENQINVLYGKIGYEVYVAYYDNPIPEAADLMKQVASLQSKIEEHRNRIKEINAANTCPQCNSKINKNMAFCSVCGYKLPVQEQPEKIKVPAFCSSCGSPIEPGTSFCSSCGAKIV